VPGSWPSLRPGGWTATAGSVLLALSVCGLGGLLTAAERMACRASDPGCTAARQLSNTGGRLDDILTTSAMLVLFCVTCGDIIGVSHGVGGVFERLIALTAAVWLGAVGVGVLRRARQARVVPRGSFTGAEPGLRAR
jgi:hypothetical protein